MEDRIPGAFVRSAIFLAVDLALLFIMTVMRHYFDFEVATWSDAVYSGGMSVGGRLLFFQGPLQLLLLTFIYARKKPPSLLLCLGAIAMSFFVAGMMMTKGDVYEALCSFMPRQISFLLTGTVAWLSVRLMTKKMERSSL